MPYTQAQDSHGCPGSSQQGQQAASGPNPNPQPLHLPTRWTEPPVSPSTSKSDSFIKVLGPVGGSSWPNILSLSALDSTSRGPSR